MEHVFSMLRSDFESSRSTVDASRHFTVATGQVSALVAPISK